ncbi:MAG: hypothetical protein GWP75_13460 [Planctomycetia bacterium]|nr:hypothetical protein [Planctomycetia bacterium]
MVLSTILIVFAAGACSSNKTPARNDLAWPWWPTEMQISDLTRVGRPGDDGRRPLEVRVHFTDADGDSSKGCGTLEVAVTREGERDDPVIKRISLDDRAMSMAHFERVTGCYLVLVDVDLPNVVAGRRLRIDVAYQGRDGATLSQSTGFDLPVSLKE